MNIKENYMKRADAFMGGEEEEETQGNPVVKQHLYKMVMEQGANEVLAALIEVLSEEEPELAKVLHDAIGPLPE